MPVAGILLQAPRRHPDRQAQQKTAAPHGRTLSTSVGRPTSSRSPDPARPILTRSPPSTLRARVARARAPPAAGGTTHRHRAPARCSGGEEARALPVPKTAPSGRPAIGTFRSGRPSPRLAPCSRSAASRRHPIAAAAAGMKVVIVVGPGRLEHRQLHLQRQAATPRRPAPTAPPCTRSTARTRRGPGSRRRPGRQRPHLPRPRQRLAKPVRPLPAYTKDGLGLNATPARQLERQVLRRVLRRPRTSSSRRTRS